MKEKKKKIQIDNFFYCAKQKYSLLSDNSRKKTY